MRVAIFTLLAIVVFAAFEDDRVYELPECSLNTKMYSGYLTTKKDHKETHYVLVESEDNPAEDPLLIWFNGGPGCSSLLGMFMELGPCVVDDGETEFFTNPHPWNQRANVLFIEQPAGVGYSWANTTDDMKFNDLISSRDNLIALKHFYVKFPEYKGRDLYISGESYAGIYVPYLAFRIH